VSSNTVRRVAAVSFAALMLGVLALCLSVDWAICSEAYGAGPPYYGRTTNMDKWQDPMGRLVVVNVTGFGLAAALGFGLWRLRGAKR
jgi:hypothetical protein